MKIHLRAAGDMGKDYSSRTFCKMGFNPAEYGKSFFRITENPEKVTCKRCIEKLKTLNKT